MKVVFISDTHEQHNLLEIPKCDLLIHSGDLTNRGSKNAVRDINHWFGTLKEKGLVEEVVCIAGNHDFLFEESDEYARKLMTNCVYLKDEEFSYKGLRIYGSPYQPTFFNWAFNRDRGEELKKIWSKIPSGLDILITHGPPITIMDKAKCVNTHEIINVGCENLLFAVKEKKPRIHAFGHIHEGYGIYDDGNTTFINASSVNNYGFNDPIVLEV